MLKKTPLNAVHHASGARMVEFAGWEMPLDYSGISDEHLAVRSRVGLFDVSHMGVVELAGRDALAGVQWLTSNDASKLAVGQIQYTALTTEAGTFVDDTLVYRLGEDHYFMVPNAATVSVVYRWITEQAHSLGGDIAVVNTSPRYAILAVQGPEALGILQTLTAVDLEAIKYYWFSTGEVAGVRATISRTGYTGEDGFELFVPATQATHVWKAIVSAGKDKDLRPCGLGARDTLRLEASMRLSGQDMDRDTTVLEAGLERFVAWDKPKFLGAERLREQKADGLTRKLVAFEMVDRAIARHGHNVIRDDRPCGVVTSGTQTPFLKKAIGFAMVPVDMTSIGNEFDIDIRGRRAAARVVREPFYKRPKRAAGA